MLSTVHSISISLLFKVLGNGRILEFETPRMLLSDPTSQFSSLVNQTGVAEAEHLRMLINDVKSNNQQQNDEIVIHNETVPLLTLTPAVVQNSRDWWGNSDRKSEMSSSSFSFFLFPYCQKDDFWTMTRSKCPLSIGERITQKSFTEKKL